MNGRNIRQTRIAVVGGGPVGLAGAILLSRAGHEVCLIAPAAPHDLRTSALLGGSIDLLADLGLWPVLRDHAAPLRVMRIIDGTKRLIRAPEVAFEAWEIGRDEFGFNIPNAALVSALQAEVATSDVQHIDATASDVAFDREGVTLTMSTGAAVKSKLVVAADGRRSSLREAAGITTRDWRHDQAALVCNLAHEADHNDTSIEFHTETGPFTMVPLPGRRSSLVWIDTPARTRNRARLAPPVLAGEIEERSAYVLGAINVDSPVKSFPLSGMRVDRFAARRIVLAGESAHVFPPIGAQGLNLGYRDIGALAHILADSRTRTDPGGSGVLERYNRDRRGDARLRTTAVDILNRSLLANFLPVQGLRGGGLFLLERIPALRRWAMTMGVGGVSSSRHGPKEAGRTAEIR